MTTQYGACKWLLTVFAVVLEAGCNELAGYNEPPCSLLLDTSLTLAALETAHCYKVMPLIKSKSAAWLSTFADLVAFCAIVSQPSRDHSTAADLDTFARDGHSMQTHTVPSNARISTNVQFA